MITIQYLEDTPELPRRKISAVVEKLHAAVDLLPITHLLIGWNLPARMLEACRKEADQLGIRFLRWHPLLTGDAVFQPRPDLQVVGATGKKVLGFRGMPEFTFVCPNHPDVQEAISRRLDDLVRVGMYQGFFLDRVRFPSPLANPVNDLGCFCVHCCRRAAAMDLDLERVQMSIVDLSRTADGRRSLVEILFGRDGESQSSPLDELIRSFLKFRHQSITEFVSLCAHPLRQAGMEIGLDCFSPALTGMVGQDLGILSTSADWIKVMSYAHTLGPAGIPFELLGLFDYLINASGLGEASLLEWMGNLVRFSLPATRRGLEKKGIPSASLELELRRGVSSSLIPVLAGFELVQIEGVAELNDAQILADLEAVRQSGVAGLSISWDLWDIPLSRFALVRRAYL